MTAQAATLCLSDNDARIVGLLLRRHLPTHAVQAFGSRVTGWPGGRGVKPHSDLDLAVSGRPDDLALAMLRADLDDSDLPWRVDVCLLDDLPDTLRGLIRQQGVSLQQPGDTR